jgi:hypothetical protein
MRLLKTASVQVRNPLMRRRASWPMLSKAELRLLMAGLVDWESRSRGPIRARIRKKRLEAVEYYRRVHGPLAEDRLWVPRKSTSAAARQWDCHRRHDPARERLRGVLWHEA